MSGVRLTSPTRSAEDGLEQGRHEPHRLVALDEPHAPERLGGPGEPERAPIGLERPLQRRQPEPETRVDRALGRVEDRHRLAALGGLVEQPAHHPGQDPAPSMGRCDADVAQAGRSDDPAGHGQPHRERGRATDPAVAVLRADQPVGLPELPVDVEHRVGVVVGEGGRDRADPGPQGVGVGRRLGDLDGVVVHGVIVPREVSGR